MENCKQIDDYYVGNNRYAHLYQREDGSFFTRQESNGGEVVTSELSVDEAKKWVRVNCDIAVYADTFSGCGYKFTKICDRILRDDIYCCMTDVANYIINSSDDNDKPYTFEDIEWKGYECETEDDGYNGLEWIEVWEISDYLADKLYAIGEPVIRGFHSLWFRNCTGQSIALDWVIRRIVLGMMYSISGKECDYDKEEVENENE